MRLLPRLSSFWRNLFSKNRVEQELKEEVEAYLELLIEMKIKQGLNPEAARRAALIELGGGEQVREQVREVRMGYYLETLWQDVRYGLRMLRKSPGFTAVAALSLALGIGANTAIFSVIDALMLKTLSVNRPEQLVMVWARDDSPRRPNYTFYHPMFVKLRDLSQVFSGVSAIWRTTLPNLTINGPGGRSDPEQVEIGLASGNYFSVLGVTPMIGRLFTADDDRVPGGHPVAVLSYDYWTRRFAAASDVVGRTFTLSGTTYTILGVTPRGFSGEWVGSPTDLWVPFMMRKEVLPGLPSTVFSTGRFPTRVIARLKPGLTMSQAQAASNILYQQLLREEAGSNPSPQELQQIARERLVLEPGSRGYSPQRESFAQPLAILMTAVGLVLLIACANVATLLLGRAAARQREIAVRLALGAGRLRIGRQLLTESLLLATLGGSLGVLFAVWGTNALAATVGSAPVSLGERRAGIALDLHLDGRSLALTAALCLLTGILFGLAPAFRGSKVSLSPTLGERSTNTSGSRFGLGNALVIAQVALSLLLLVGAGLLVRTMNNLRVQNLGLDRQHTLLVWTSPGQTGRQGPEMMNFWQTVRERLSALPGVVSASASNGGLLTGVMLSPGQVTMQMLVEGQPPKPTNIPGPRSFIAPRFFETLGIPLVAGREFTERDTALSPPVVIVNETMARFYFGDQNPIGQRVRFPWQPAGTPSTEIVGVVKDFVEGTPRAANQQRFSFYFPYRDSQAGPVIRIMTAVVRTAGDPLAMAARVRQELREIDPNLSVLKINTVEEQLSDVLTQDRAIAMLSSFFGVLAVLLSCLGLYGVISYAVARRTNEIGIRLALGATPANVRALILKESLWLALAGIALGVPATLVVTRLISSRLFGVSAADPLTIGGVTILIIVVAVLAALFPARRASRVDPMVALRYE